MLDRFIVSSRMLQDPPQIGAEDNREWIQLHRPALHRDGLVPTRKKQQVVAVPVVRHRGVGIQRQCAAELLAGACEVVVTIPREVCASASESSSSNALSAFDFVLE